MNRNKERFEAYVRARQHEPQRWLHKYTSQSTARKIVENETVRFSSPTKFNDPFDTQWNTLWQISTPEFNQAFVAKIARDDLELDRISDEETRRFIVQEREKLDSMAPDERGKYIEDVSESLSRDIKLPPTVTDLLNRLRIFCLASVPDSVPMWSYYAQEHQGVVLTFDSMALERAWSMPVDRVRYLDQLPEVLEEVQVAEYLDQILYDGARPNIDHDRAAYLWTFTKATGWSHEAEWRFVFVADKGDEELYTPVRLPMHALASAVAGCRADKQEFDLLANSILSRNPSATIGYADRHPSEFALMAKFIDTSLSCQ